MVRLLERSGAERSFVTVFLSFVPLSIDFSRTKFEGGGAGDESLAAGAGGGGGGGAGDIRSARKECQTF